MDKVDEAFEAVQRAAFMLPHLRQFSDVDEASPIGHGQTISQPYTVRKMLEWLDVRPGQKVLDIGSGSGWTTALLSHLVGLKGKVYAVERVPELLEFGEDNAKRLGVRNAKFLPAGDKFGLTEQAPFDRILVSASADELPKELVDQLKSDGKMVIPVHQDILEVTKLTNGKLDITPHPGFVFVPLL